MILGQRRHSVLRVIHTQKFILRTFIDLAPGEFMLYFLGHTTRWKFVQNVGKVKLGKLNI